MSICSRSLSRRRLLLGGSALASAAALSAPAASADPQEAPNARASTFGTVALVPIDDRPYTLYAPTELGRSTGYEVTTPERSVLGRHFTPGDGARAASWFAEEARTAHASIVALPMIAYGGLLNSRNSSVPQEVARENLETVRLAARRSPGRVHAFDTIMRLTPEGPWRTDLRKWATLVDEVENLGMEEKRDQLEAFETIIPLEVREDYLATRARNHALNLQMVRWAAAGDFDMLVLGQDDASGTGLHRPEAEALQNLIDELGAGDRVVLYPGADVVASVLLARIAVEDAGITPAVSVEYSRWHGEDWTAPYQNIPYARLIAGYVRIIGGHVVDSADEADVVLMANTGSGHAPIDAFAESLIAHLDAGRTVALGDDAIAGRTDMRLMDLLDPRIRRAELEAYSGWNIGIPISQSLSRLAFRSRLSEGDLPPVLRDASQERAVQSRTEWVLGAARSSLQLTVSEWVQTNSYRSYIRNDTTAYARELGEEDPQNIEVHYEAIDEFARTGTLEHAEPMFAEHFQDVARAAGDVDGEELVVAATEVEAWNIFLPWLRTGEIACEPEIGVQEV